MQEEGNQEEQILNSPMFGLSMALDTAIKPERVEVHELMSGTEMLQNRTLGGQDTVYSSSIKPNTQDKTSDKQLI